MDIQITQKSDKMSEINKKGQTRKQHYLTDTDVGIDPELNTDVEIPLPGDKNYSAKTRNSALSGKSRKSCTSSKKSEPVDTNIVRSRGRPIKPHETEPFLSIDNLPPEKSFVSEKSNTPRVPSRPVAKTPQHSRSKSPTLATQLQQMSAYMSPYSHTTPGAPRSLLATILTEEESLHDLEDQFSDRSATKSASSKKLSSAGKRNRFSPSIATGATPNSPHITRNPQGVKSRPSTGSRSRPNTTPQLDPDSRPFSAPINQSKNEESQNLKVQSSLIGSESRPSTGQDSRQYTQGSGSRPSTGSRVKSRSEVSSRPGSRVDSRAGFRAKVTPRRSVPSRNGRITPFNTPYNSPHKQLRAPNHHIKSPFKHNVTNPEMMLDGRQTPSMGLKERTSLATYHVNKVLMVAGEKDAAKVKGQLLKGKLKPLYPVNVNGPNIQQCRGIISETKSYGASPSRTLQRRLHLVNTIPNVHEYLYDRPRTVESVHQTSIASSIDEYVENEGKLDSNRSLPDEIIYTSQKSSSFMEPFAPENTFIPLQNMEDTQPELEADQTPRMFATEINPQHPYTDTSDNTDMEISNQLQHELYIGESNQVCADTDKIHTNNNQNNNNDIRAASTRNSNEDQEGSDKENVSVGKTEDSAESQNASRPPRIGSSSKSVRFADDKSKNDEAQTSKEIKQITNTNIAKQQKDRQENVGEDNNETAEVNGETKEEEDKIVLKNKQNSKSSCKPDDNKVLIRKKDEDDDKGNDHNKGKDKTDNTGSGNSRSDTTGTRGNSGTNKEDNSGSHGKDKSGSDNGKKQTIGKHSAKTRPRSASLTKSNTKNSTLVVKPSQTHKKYTQNARPSSASSAQSSSRRQHCSRFEQSPASKTRTNKLQVTSVLHGESVQTVLCSESPLRSRSASPSRQRTVSPYRPVFPCSNYDEALVPMFDHRQQFSNESQFNPISNANTRAIGSCNIEDSYFNDMNSQRSKVKFMLEGEGQPKDSIFLEDEDYVGLKQDKPITFDNLESEIEGLRLEIQGKVIQGMEEELAESEEEIEDVKVDLELPEDNSDILSDNQSVAMETETVDTIRGDYSNLLDKYRQRCMDRSETFGALSVKLTTPREATNSRKHSNPLDSRATSQMGDLDRDLDTPTNRKLSNSKQVRHHNGTITTDSGCGSIENLSELSRSRSASIAVSDVPRLQLGGGSTSDLGLGTGRSDGTLVEGQSGGRQETGADNKNLLEMVCDQLSPLAREQKKELESKKETEEDVSKLKVVATTKSLSKSKQLKVSPPTKAPFPPLCFTINARPPRGYLYYFAYGPDMNPNRFSSYIQREITDRHWGLLFGFNLIFNKKGYSEEAGGLANLEFNPLRSVEGCIYKITPAELHILDKCLGYPQHNEHLVLPVWMSNSNKPDDLGVAQYCVPALTYIAQNDWTETEKSLPCDYALSQCIKSSDILTNEYRESLVTMATSQHVQVSA